KAGIMRFASYVALVVLPFAMIQTNVLARPQQGGPAALLETYPDFLERIDGNELVWKDGARMRIDDGKGGKILDKMLSDPDIKAMFVMASPVGEKGLPPEKDLDPGRVRYTPLFVKMYGDCRTSNVLADATDVVWLRNKYGKAVKFSKINGAAAAL